MLLEQARMLLDRSNDAVIKVTWMNAATRQPLPGGRLLRITFDHQSRRYLLLIRTPDHGYSEISTSSSDWLDNDVVIMCETSKQPLRLSLALDSYLTFEDYLARAGISESALIKHMVDFHAMYRQSTFNTHEAL